MKTQFGLFIMLAGMLFTSSIFGQETFVYPAQGQSAEQTARDRKACAEWARQQTGIDPSQPVAVASPSPQEGQVVRGSARGAAVGAVGGAIGGDAGTGAAIGAASGALFGGIRKRRDAEAQQANEQAAVAAARNDYDRAYKACLEGKGYTVK